MQILIKWQTIQQPYQNYEENIEASKGENQET